MLPFTVTLAEPTRAEGESSEADRVLTLAVKLQVSNVLGMDERGGWHYVPFNSASMSI